MTTFSDVMPGELFELRRADPPTHISAVRVLDAVSRQTGLLGNAAVLKIVDPVRDRSGLKRGELLNVRGHERVSVEREAIPA